MLKNMRKQYCKAGMPTTQVDLAGGKKLTICKLAYSRFIATCRKNKWNYEKPRPSATEETLNWFLRKKGFKI